MALLGALHYSSHGMNLLGRFLTDECAAWNLEQKVSRTQLTAIVEHAISRGLVQRVTWKWLRDQKRWLIQNGYGLPHYGMPFEGDIDFTEQGVEFARDRYEAEYGRKLPRPISQVHKNWRTILTTEVPEDGKQWVWSDCQQYVLSDFTYHVRI
ncbi:hypothetical protein [Planctopirus hydrillae]|nr:hypothetical protein [Planctopirus hydrillae]